MPELKTKNKTKIGWVRLASRTYGGAVYEEGGRRAIADDFDVELFEVGSKYFKKGYLKLPELLFNLIRLKGEKDLWVRDFYSTVVFPFDRTRGKNLAIILHIDFSQDSFLSKPINFLIEKAIYRNLKKTDAVLTMSEYWRQHFLKKGCPNVYKIYYGFNLDDFSISDEEVEDFKNRFNLKDKPIIYIGNCQAAKGVADSYRALKDLDAYLITSGGAFVDIPAINLNLKYRDYLTMLKASSVAVTMSKFKEGWCISTHEAMLLRTPVIGSGLGGMRELLEGGGQIVCEEFGLLKEKVEHLLNHPEERKKIGEVGFNFAKTFTKERFNRGWLNLMKELS